ncbi:MAG: hypothetical protein ACK44W_02170 [Planctomycetota bacterium]
MTDSHDQACEAARCQGRGGNRIEPAAQVVLGRLNERQEKRRDRQGAH